MKSKIAFLILFIVINFNSLQAQVTQEWAVRYSGPEMIDDNARSLAIDGSGNVYVTGSGGSDYVTIKYNSNGDSLWVRRYNGPGNGFDYAYSVGTGDSGNVYVTGATSPDGFHYDYATVKYNSNGVEQWVQIYDTPGSSRDITKSMVVDGLGNVYITGFSGNDSNYYVFATIKYNSSGVRQWVQIYTGNGNGDYRPSDIAVDGSGNVYVTGSSGEESNNFKLDYVTIKYNSSGVQQWIQLYNGVRNENDYATSLTVDGSDNVYVTGSSGGIGPVDDYATVKYNSLGDSVWVATYSRTASSNDNALSIGNDVFGNVYVTGNSWISGTNPVDIITIKYNLSGAQQWVQSYDGPENRYDEAASLEISDSGNVYVTGVTSQIGSFGFDYITIKYNSYGVQHWFQRFEGQRDSEDFATAIAIDNWENVFVTGYCDFSDDSTIFSDNDYVTIKYSQSTNIQHISSEIPMNYSLSQNYPNPFNPVTKIKFYIKHDVRQGTKFIKLVIYNSLGKKVNLLVNQYLQPGSYEVNFDGNNLSSGVYFYELTVDGNIIDSKRMLLLK